MKSIFVILLISDLSFALETLESDYNDEFIGCSIQQGGGKRYPKSPCSKISKSRAIALNKCLNAGFDKCEIVGRSCERVMNGYRVCIKVHGKK